MFGDSVCNNLPYELVFFYDILKFNYHIIYKFN